MIFNRFLGVALAANVASLACAGLATEVNGTGNETDIAASFDEQLATELAYIATASYCEQLDTWNCGLACDHVSPVEQTTILEDVGTGVRAVVGVWKDACIVAFAGTRDLVGWSFNFASTNLVDKPDCWFEGRQCRVSWSFQNQFYTIKPQMEAALDKLNCSDGRPIDLTGHSMGGAMALLASWDLALKGYNLRHLYTFGAPRVGNKDFAMAFRTTVAPTFFRVTRGDDPIVLLPFLAHGFWHTGVEVYYQHDLWAGVRFCAGIEDMECARAEAPLFFPNMLRCAKAERCGHYLYMHNIKVGRMGAGSCVRAENETSTTSTPDIFFP